MWIIVIFLLATKNIVWSLDLNFLLANLKPQFDYIAAHIIYIRNI